MSAAAQKPRYEAEQSISGSWMVFDRHSGQPAKVGGYMLLGMEMHEAMEQASGLCSRDPGRADDRPGHSVTTAQPQTLPSAPTRAGPGVQRRPT